MPIPFSDVDEVDGLGSAAFLKVERLCDGACCLGALLVITARGEPLEFGYNRVRVPQPFLWREADLRRYTERRLTASLLSVCSQQPRLIVCMANEVSTWLFGQDVRLEVPVVRVGGPHVAWQPAPPDNGSTERRLFEYMAAHGLLLEPFERAATGLREVYGPSPCLSVR